MARSKMQSSSSSASESGGSESNKSNRGSSTGVSQKQKQAGHGPESIGGDGSSSASDKESNVSSEGEEEEEEDHEETEGVGGQKRKFQELSDGDSDSSSLGPGPNKCVICRQEFGVKDIDNAENGSALVVRKGINEFECKACFNTRIGTFGRGETHICKPRKGKAGNAATGQGSYFPKLLKKHKKVRRVFFKNRKKHVQDVNEGRKTKQGRYSKKDITPSIFTRVHPPLGASHLTMRLA